MMLIVLLIAREQLRAECAALGRKSYEPAWQTVEIEDHYDWWGMMIVRGRKYDLVYTHSISSCIPEPMLDYDTGEGSVKNVMLDGELYCLVSCITINLVIYHVVMYHHHFYHLS